VPREQVTGWCARRAPEGGARRRRRRRRRSLTRAPARRTPFPGGAPANVAAALGKLGVRVAFLSALGRDELGDQMVGLLEGARRAPRLAPSPRRARRCQRGAPAAAQARAWTCTACSAWTAPRATCW